MERNTITTNRLRSICWLNDSIIDWINSGMLYSPDGSKKQCSKYGFVFSFDASITSSCGTYAFIYQKLGTKGVLLKNGEQLREINRSYYFAENYEYPAAFATVNDVTYLIHCPFEYNRLEFEIVETGEILTNVPGREPSDLFYSRLEVSDDSRFLISKGWLWHPLDVVEIFDIAACIANPLLLDKSDFTPDFGVEIGTASFVNNTQILIGSSDEVFDEDNIIIPPKHIAIWNLLSGEITNVVKVQGEFGNLFAINDEFAWDTFGFPKIINLKTGEIVDIDKSIDSGKQNSSIVNRDDKLPLVAFNRQTKQLAIGANEKIEVLTPGTVF